MAFAKYIVRIGIKNFLGEMCDVTIVWICICTCVLSQWKMVEELSCVLCEFILLEYEEGNII
jgi:hypothetical protein